MRTCRAVLVLTALAAGLASCQSSPPGRRASSGPIPLLDAASASAAGLSIQQTNDAVKLYTAKCIRCHKSYDPARYTEAQWRTWFSKMSRKARLTPAQEESLSRYLNVWRAANVPQAKKPE